MNVHTMMALLGIRLEDAGGSIFTESERLQFLNNAQLKLAQRLHNSYLTELQVIETSKTATNGKYAISSLSNTVLRGGEGIMKVKINGGLYCTRIDVKDIKRTENPFYKGSSTNPLYYVFQNYIYVIAGVTSPVIDIYYLKLPTTLKYKLDVDADAAPATTTFVINSSESPSSSDDYYNGAPIYSVEHDSYHVITHYDGTGKIVTVFPAASGNFTDGQEIYFLTQDFDALSIPGIICDINESLHEIVVSLAEMEAWAMDAKLDRREAAKLNADSIIDVLNFKYTEAIGIGTKNRRLGGN